MWRNLGVGAQQAARSGVLFCNIGVLFCNFGVFFVTSGFCFVTLGFCFVTSVRVTAAQRCFL
jgi:hypothetical protein